MADASKAHLVLEHHADGVFLTEAGGNLHQIGAEFFPVFACLGIALRVRSIGSELAPAVTVQHAVDRSQREAVAQLLLQQELEWGHDHYATQGSLGQHLIEQRRFLFHAGFGAVACSTVR